MSSRTPLVEKIFDADNHYWETSDAFTRYRSAEFADRGVRVAEHEGQQRYFIRDKLHPHIPGPGDLHMRPKPGALFNYFAGKAPADPTLPELRSEHPKDHPEFYNRDARLKKMDEQGVEACWMFPTHGVCIEGPMQPDTEASLHIIGGFNRWINDEWGFAYKNRIFSAPLFSLSDVDLARRELRWALDQGVRIIVTRPGPAFTADGAKSPADPMFDPFWADVQEAGLITAVHPGFDDGYRHVEKAVSTAWGVDTDGPKGMMNRSSSSHGQKFVGVMMRHRLVHDYAGSLLSFGLFERFPRLRVAFVENGADWVGPLLKVLRVAHAQSPGMFKKSPVDQFHENCWVNPFIEEEFGELAKHIPVERILFGSDWPHAEGCGEPREFLETLTGFNPAETQKIMYENGRALIRA